MPNQRNFPERLINNQEQRPLRLTEKDKQLIQQTQRDGTPAEKEVVFGQTNRDVVEVYVYDDLDRIVNHTTLRLSDPALRLLTFTPDAAQIGVGQNNTPDNLQVDLVSVLNRMAIPPGRYSITMNFFRDEIGKEFVENARPASNESRLYVAEISPSRTELRLRAVAPKERILNEIREFVIPSVPRLQAQALIDQTFGTSLNIQEGEAITLSRIEAKFDSLELNDSEELSENEISALLTTNKLSRANVSGQFASFILEALPNIRDAVLDEIAGRVDDLQIQSNEMQQIIADSTRKVLQKMVSAQMLHPKLQLIDATDNLVRP